MAPHSSILAWKIPWTEEPARLQSMGSLRVGHNWESSLSLCNFMHWRRKWQPTLVFLPGEPQGRGSLVGCRLWGCTELGLTEPLNWTELINFGGKLCFCWYCYIKIMKLDAVIIFNNTQINPNRDNQRWIIESEWESPDDLSISKPSLVPCSCLILCANL